MGLIFLAVTFLLMWVLFILPQQRRMKAHQALVLSLETGDEVMTTAGIYGRIVDLDDESVSIDVAPGVTIRFARSAVANKVGASAAADEPGADVVPARRRRVARSANAGRPAGTAADRALKGPVSPPVGDSEPPPADAT